MTAASARPPEPSCAGRGNGATSRQPAPASRNQVIPWYRRFSEQHQRETRLLSLELRGALADIIDLIFIQNGPIPNDDRWIANMLHVDIRKWKHVRRKLMSAGQLYETADGLMCVLALDELQARNKRYLNCSKGAQLREATKCNRTKNSSDIPAAMTTRTAAGTAVGSAADLSEKINGFNDRQTRLCHGAYKEERNRNKKTEAASSSVCSETLATDRIGDDERPDMDGTDEVAMPLTVQPSSQGHGPPTARSSARRTASPSHSALGPLAEEAPPSPEALWERLSEAAGAALSPASVGLHMVSEPLGWLADGAALEQDILPTLRALGRKARPGSVQSWAYFRRSVSDAKARRARGLAPDSTDVVAPGQSGGALDEAWTRAEQTFQSGISATSAAADHAEVPA